VHSTSHREGVTVQAGHALNREVMPCNHAGRALTIIGDIEVKTVAGALSTGKTARCA